MRKIRIIIERNKDGFWGHAEGDEIIYGGGDTVEACKQDVMDSIETLKELDKKNRPGFLDDEYELTQLSAIEKVK